MGPAEITYLPPIAVLAEKKRLSANPLSSKRGSCLRGGWWDERYNLCNVKLGAVMKKKKKKNYIIYDSSILHTVLRASQNTPPWNYEELRCSSEVCNSWNHLLTA